MSNHWDLDESLEGKEYLRLFSTWLSMGSPNQCEMMTQWFQFSLRVP
jgi:hypothetical protein